MCCEENEVGGWDLWFDDDFEVSYPEHADSIDDSDPPVVTHLPVAANDRLVFCVVCGSPPTTRRCEPLPKLSETFRLIVRQS